MATADSKINITNTITAAKDPIKEPEIRSQNELNCWQIENQFVLTFPLCAKYTIDAAAEAPAVNSPRITFKNIIQSLKF